MQHCERGGPCDDCPLAASFWTRMSASPADCQPPRSPRQLEAAATGSSLSPAPGASPIDLPPAATALISALQVILMPGLDTLALSASGYATCVAEDWLETLPVRCVRCLDLSDFLAHSGPGPVPKTSYVRPMPPAAHTLLQPEYPEVHGAHTPPRCTPPLPSLAGSLARCCLCAACLKTASVAIVADNGQCVSDAAGTRREAARIRPGGLAACCQSLMEEHKLHGLLLHADGMRTTKVRDSETVTRRRARHPCAEPAPPVRALHERA